MHDRRRIRKAQLGGVQGPPKVSASPSDEYLPLSIASQMRQRSSHPTAIMPHSIAETVAASHMIHALSIDIKVGLEQVRTSNEDCPALP